MNHLRQHCERPQRRKRNGASMVEVVLVLPLLLALTIGAVDLGRYAITYITITNAARAGAGVGSMNSYTPATFSAWEQEVRDAIVTECESMSDFDESLLQFPTPEITLVVGEPRRMRIQVGYPFETVAPWPFIPESMTIATAVEMPFIR